MEHEQQDEGDAHCEVVPMDNEEEEEIVIIVVEIEKENFVLDELDEGVEPLLKQRREEEEKKTMKLILFF